MNDHYVSIKVDREERPDVDAIYMAAVQALTGSGGWPMSVWLTPEREPFFGGTYFPPRDGARGARHGFLTHPARACTRTYDERSGARRARGGGAGRAPCATRMEAAAPPARPAPGAPRPSLIADTRRRSSSALFDDRDGGAAARAQVPLEHADPPAAARRTRRDRRRRGAADGGADAGEDGGGRHVRPARRAASTATRPTRAGWCPHFEKMLYDNALLAVALRRGLPGDRARATSRASRARRSTTCCAR